MRQGRNLLIHENINIGNVMMMPEKNKPKICLVIKNVDIELMRKIMKVMKQHKALKRLGDVDA